jgi:hypothetical protein
VGWGCTSKRPTAAEGGSAGAPVSRPVAGAPKASVATHVTAIDAASERRFELANASRTFAVELQVPCAGERCGGQTSITLRPKSAQKPAHQTLVIEDTQFSLETDGNPQVNVIELHGKPSLLVFGDFNFDAVEDLAVNRPGGGGYVGSYYDVYLGKPRTGELQKSKAFGQLAGPGSLGMFVVDAERRRLLVSSKDGCCLHVTKEYLVADGRPRKARSVTHDSRGNRGVLMTVADFAEDQVTVVPFAETPPPGVDSGATDTAQGQLPAFMVVAGDFATRAEAEQALQVYEDKGWPSHDAYPRIVAGADVTGLPPGRWLLAAALADDRGVAQAVAAAIPGTLVREVRAAHPEALYLIEIKRLTLRWQATDIPPVDNFTIMLSQHCQRVPLANGKPSACHYTHNGDSGQTVQAAKRMVLPFTYDPAGEAARIFHIGLAGSSIWLCDSELLLRERPTFRTRTIDNLTIRCDPRE